MKKPLCLPSYDVQVSLSSNLKGIKIGERREQNTRATTRAMEERHDEKRPGREVSTREAEM